MDGLNCNEIQYSELFPNNTIFRLDAEFFSREAITIEKKIKEISCFYLKPQEVVSGPFGSSLKSESYLEQGDVPFVRIENIRGGFDINMDNIIYISNADNARIKNSQLSINDIVLSKVGNSIGFFARVDESIGLCNISENNIGIKLSTYSEEEKHYILTYLNSFYAQKLVLRRTSGNAQPKLNVGDLCYIPIPSFSDNFYKNISLLIVNSRKLNLKSKQIYCDTEKQLIVVLKIDDLNNKHENINIKSLVESFGCGGRLDAEYYQSKYEKYKVVVQNSKLGFTFVKTEFVLVNQKCDRILSKYPYIEIGDIDVATGTVTHNTVLTEDLPDNAKIMTKANDILVSTVRPNRGAVAILEQDDLLVSGAFTVLREKGDYPKEVLQVLLRSEMYRDWMLRYNVGTSYPVIKDNDILNLPIPILNEELKKEIVNSVQESSKLRKKAKKLLDIAVKAVEMAIEADEETALAWLSTQNV